MRYGYCGDDRDTSVGSGRQSYALALMSAGVLCRSEIWKRDVSISRTPRFLTWEKAHHSLASGYVLRWSINNNLHQVILEAIDDRSAATLLHDVMYRNLSTTLAAEEVVWAATAKGSDVYLESLSLQIGFLASGYSFLYLQTVDLVKGVLSFLELSIDAKLRELVTALGDAMKLDGGRLFKEDQETKELIHDLINLNRLIARAWRRKSGEDRDRRFRWRAVYIECGVGRPSWFS